MSNIALSMKLSELKSRLAKERAYNSQLRSELNAINSAASDASRELSSYDARVQSELGNANNDILSSEQKGISSIEIQENIEFLFRRFKNVESATKRIRECNNRKYYEFANYRNIRKIVQGMLDNMNLGMVDMSVITRAVEINHLQLPDYWLTCALLSIVAWYNDDEAMARRCVERAVKLSRKDSIIFYMLFNMRMQRRQAALKWLRCYEEDDFKGADSGTFLLLFSLMCQCISMDVDEELRKEVEIFVWRVFQLVTQMDPMASAKASQTIVGYLNIMGTDAPLNSYPTMAKHLKDAAELSCVLGKAKNNTNIVDFFQHIVSFTHEHKNRILENYIEELVATPNDAEIEVFKTIEYNERIIRLKGDVDVANDEQHAANAHNESKLNLLQEMIDWIYDAKSPCQDGKIKSCLFIMCRPFQEMACEAYRKAYLNMMRTVHPAVIDGYSTDLDFMNFESENTKVVHYFEEIRDGELAKVSDVPVYVAGGICGLSLAGSLGCRIAGGNAAIWMIPLLVLAAICLIVMMGLKISNKITRLKLRNKCTDDIAKTQACIKQIYGEFSAFCDEIRQYDALYSEIVNLLRKGSGN